MPTYFSYHQTPVGRMLLTSDGAALTGLWLPNAAESVRPAMDWLQNESVFVHVKRELDEFFAGERREFSIRTKLAGTKFQQRVWQELERIPFGKTISYAELAARVGKPKASRAVGSANGRNPVPILIPCHRVIATGGKLGGYGGGLDLKRYLL